ncbi:MAG: hypothetical protein M3125_06905 [Gemmatimonadota bacterium]|nr:hypothetical protein [Gemmatimonadota bacterium]
MRATLRVLLLATSFAIGTWVLGWWAIPLFAAVAGGLARHVSGQALAAGLAAAVAWGVLLAWSALRGSIWSFASQVGGAIGVSGVLLIALTLVFPALLAWLAAFLAQTLARGKAATN